MTTFSPTVRRRRLSRALARLREDAGLDGAEVAKMLGWSPSKISAIERDQWKRPNPRDVKDLLDVYGITDAARRDALLRLAQQARGRGWWFNYRDVLRSELVDFEAEATAIRAREVSVVPGLLQTSDYARAVFEGGRQERIDERIAARMRRQAVLDTVRVCAVIDEGVLRRRIGGSHVMRAQIARLIELARRPDIVIRVLPEDAGAHPAMGEAFTILDFAEDPSLVYAESAAQSVLRDEPGQVAVYTGIHDRLKGMALSPEESIEHMEQAAARLGEG